MTSSLNKVKELQKNYFNLNFFHDDADTMVRKIHFYLYNDVINFI